MAETKHTEKTKCRHAAFGPYNSGKKQYWRCDDCCRYFRTPPEPFERGLDYAAFLKDLHQARNVKTVFTGDIRSENNPL